MTLPSLSAVATTEHQSAGSTPASVLSMFATQLVPPPEAEDPAAAVELLPELPHAATARVMTVTAPTAAAVLRGLACLALRGLSLRIFGAPWGIRGTFGLSPACGQRA